MWCSSKSPPPAPSASPTTSPHTLPRARGMGLADELRMERGLVRHCFFLRPGRSETLEGIRALAIDKDHAPRWNPARIEDVTPAMVAPFFTSPWPAHAHPLAHLAWPAAWPALRAGCWLGAAAASSPIPTSPWPGITPCAIPHPRQGPISARSPGADCGFPARATVFLPFMGTPGRASCEPAFRWPAASGWRPQQQREPKPGTLAYAQSGNGSAQHLAGAFFEPLAEAEPIHVPCRGGGPALNDVMGAGRFCCSLPTWRRRWGIYGPGVSSRGRYPPACAAAGTPPMPGALEYLRLRLRYERLRAAGRRSMEYLRLRLRYERLRAAGQRSCPAHALSRASAPAGTGLIGACAVKTPRGSMPGGRARASNCATLCWQYRPWQ